MLNVSLTQTHLRQILTVVLGRDDLFLDRPLFLIKQILLELHLGPDP